MAILDVKVFQIGEVGVQPQLVSILTNDTPSDIAVAGYLNKYQQNNPGLLNETSMCCVGTKTSIGAATTELGWYEVSYNSSTKDWSLVAAIAPGTIIATTAGLLMKSVAGAAAAGGAAAQSFTDAFCTAGSNVIGNWNTQANAASVLKIVPGVGSFVVTSSANAGVGTFNYIITK